MEVIVSSAVELGVASATLHGERCSGDSHVVAPFPNGLLVAALDGVGHGESAAAASRAAGRILEKYAAEPVIALLLRCHLELRETRGVVMSMASFSISHGFMTWLGVGNVHGVLLRNDPAFPAAEEMLLLRAGVVGSQLPPLQAAVLPVSAGDTLVFSTDGVHNGFERAAIFNQNPHKAAEDILARYNKTTDDALVLVARYLGNSK